MARLPHILVVDDQHSIRLMLESGLSLNGFRVSCARNGAEALAAASTEEFDAVISDIYMPDGDGLTMVQGLRALLPSLPIVLMTAQGSVELAVRAVEEGATDFIAKPFEVSAVAALLRRHLSAASEAADAGTDISNLVEDISRSGLVGKSPAMVGVYRLIARAARSDAPVLVLGESGTGKELVARAIHAFSPREKKPFVAVNCSGLTDTLLESELFGHTKGAFTGAVGERSGLFEAADGGTIFLDELASTSAGFQASLLRVLQSGEVRRVGSTQTKRIEVRVIGASNASLREMAAAAQFRPDLFYRLSVITVELPTLRERGGDVDVLVAHFLRAATVEGKPPYRLTREAALALRSYPFPGNVRELENAIRRAVALCPNDMITLDCLPPEIAAGPGIPKESVASHNERAIIADRPTMDELQRRYLQLVLDENQGRKRRAATALGLDRRTVQRLVAKYRLRAFSDGDSEENTDAETHENADGGNS
ncbi:MAG TPA: sigma-54 dependent transcriptional regulator [Candidatus Acidoferrum sp.]|nr:sigma-54 dependent transcriptional regulator [Candidatus Acidoferrum sp.]